MQSVVDKNRKQNVGPQRYVEVYTVFCREDEYFAWIKEINISNEPG